LEKIVIPDKHDKIQSMLLAGINNLLMDMNDQQDDMRKSMSKLLDLNTSLININIDNQKENQKLLSGISRQLTLSIDRQNLMSEQLKLSLEQQTITAKELQADADEGGYITKSDTVTNSDFFIIDTDVDPGHAIKSYVIINDGNNSIYVGHNVAPSAVGPETLDADVNNPLNRFNLLKDGQHYQYSANRKTIKNIYLLASKETSQFRITLIW